MIVPARVQSSMTTEEVSRHPVGNGPFKFAVYTLDLPSADPDLSIFYRSWEIPTARHPNGLNTLCFVWNCHE